MDVTLTRILSLLPHENGKIKRGSQKTFAQSIGYGSGDIVSMWINGTSQSYKKKLHQIADEYHVSVAWLKGETDDPTAEAERAKEKAPDPKTGGEDSKVSKAINFVRCASPDEINEIENFFAYLESKRKTNETKS
jgi:hypothetical protein